MRTILELPIQQQLQRSTTGCFFPSQLGLQEAASAGLPLVLPVLRNKQGREGPNCASPLGNIPTSVNIQPLC